MRTSTLSFSQVMSGRGAPVTPAMNSALSPSRTTCGWIGLTKRGGWPLCRFTVFLMTVVFAVVAAVVIFSVAVTTSVLCDVTVTSLDTWSTRTCKSLSLALVFIAKLTLRSGSIKFIVLGNVERTLSQNNIHNIHMYIIIKIIFCIICTFSLRGSQQHKKLPFLPYNNNNNYYYYYNTAML